MVIGRAGDAEVHLENFPYEACSCGRRARWAFDAGADFSTHLFFEGIPFANDPLLGAPRCSRCDSELGEQETVELRANARLDGFSPIGFRTVLPGYRCAACGLEQAPHGSFDVRSSHGADALDAAVATIGLK